MAQIDISEELCPFESPGHLECMTTLAKSFDQLFFVDTVKLFSHKKNHNLISYGSAKLSALYWKVMDLMIYRLSKKVQTVVVLNF